MKRITTGITHEQLTKHALTTHTPTERTSPNAIVYRCAHQIFVLKSDWRTACNKQETPTSDCHCRPKEEQ